MEEKFVYDQRQIVKRLTIGDPDYKEAWSEFHRAKGALANAERALKQAAMSSKEMNAIRAVSHGDSISVREMNQSHVSVSFMELDETIAKPKAERLATTPPAKPADPAKPAPFKVPAYVDEKTVRMLLNGDMLTKAQKKKLVGGLIPGLLDE